MLRHIVAFLVVAGAACAPQAAPDDHPGANAQQRPDAADEGFPQGAPLEAKFGPGGPGPNNSRPAPPPPQIAAGTIAPVLKTRIDAAIKHIGQREVYTSYGFWTVLHAILALGPDNAYLADQTDKTTGQKIKAFDYLCNGGEMVGLQFKEHDAHSVEVVTRPGNGFFQGHPDQFIAEMAQWNIDANHIVMVNGKQHRFKDFATNCRDRTNVYGDKELSWALLVIGEYYGTDYKDNRISLEDVIRYEIRAPIAKETACGGTHRLFDLTWVYFKHRANGGKTEGVWKDVVAYLDKYKEIARNYQKEDGTFSTNFFMEPPAYNPDPNERIRSTGHILEWLSLFLSDKELKEPWMQQAALDLSTLIMDNQSLPLDGGSVYHAVHGLQIYRSRVFETKDMSWIPTPPKD